MKVIPNMVWDAVTQTIVRLETRIQELEAQNSALIDRLLIEKGHLPIDVGLQKAIAAETEANQDLFEQLTVEEVGEEQRDADEDASVRS